MQGAGKIVSCSKNSTLFMDILLGLIFFPVDKVEVTGNDDRDS